MKLVVSGAGNIGRSFVGQLFASAGYEIVFVDVSQPLVDALNREHRYRIEIRDRQPESIWVERVSAIHGGDREEVAKAVAEADILATAVGQGALPHIYAAIAAGLALRRRQGRGPVDIVICENLRSAAQAFAQGLRQYLPADFPLDDYVGLVETSIGKMVPIMPGTALREDPLVLYAEAYNTLIVDAKAFRNPIPDVPGLDPKQNMAAYVDRKAFIHNLGHAACAYLGFLADPDARRGGQAETVTRYIWQAVENPTVRRAAKMAMWESGRALIRSYPGEFNEQNQEEHIEDLLSRFGNRALGDTIFRVGRDLPRKLSREDRLVGALLMDAQEKVPAPATTLATAAAFFFEAADEKGEPFPADREFLQNLAENGFHAMITHLCGLNGSVPAEARIIAAVRADYIRLQSRGDGWLEELVAAF
jgi:mannitol-1-phosphate 5-dehydrogenase